jgi:membrane-associated protease RseP (regulator of RpoE activity)
MKHIALFIALFLADPALAQEKPKKIVVPFDLIRSRHMIVDVVVNGKGPFTLIFDTGAPATLIGPTLAKEARVPPGGPWAALFGKPEQPQINTFAMGDLKLDKVDVAVANHPVVTVLSEATGKKIDGIVGFNVFGRYITTIDYQTQKLTFVPSDFRPANMMDEMSKIITASLKNPDRESVIAPKSLLGLRVSKKANDVEDGVTVEHVFPGSPAAKAGLKAGDRLLSIDNRWTDQINDCFEAVRTLRPGETAAINILRDGKKQTLKATVAAGF